MEGDIFTRSTNNFPTKGQDDNNFFLQPDQISSVKNQSEPSRHLNDYDFNILKEDAYKDVKDEVFKLEYKISRLEKDVRDLENQIQAALEIHNYDAAEKLELRKKQMELDLSNLNEIYNDASLPAKISGGLTGKIKTQAQSIHKNAVNFGLSVLSKLPGRLSSFLQLKNSLTKLENINKSVDELISMQIPYGEAIDKYEQLSKYIIKANSIQSDISKVWRK